MTTSGTFSVTIQSPPETVWPWIAQLDKHAEWSPKPYRVELVSGEPNTVGSRYRSVGWVPGDKNHANDVEITDVITNSRFALLAHEASGTFENTYDLRPSGSGTEVTFHLVFPQMQGVAAFLLPVLFPLTAKPDNRKRLALLKTKVEATR